MIKKVLLLLLVIVLAIGVFSSFTHGVNINMFGHPIQTGSYSTIVSKSEELVQSKKKLEEINTQDFTSAKSKKAAAESNFLQMKKEYDDVANSASVEEIKKANQDEVYFLDYLWIKIGTYANDNDIKVKIEPNYDRDQIDFDVSGQYIAIINFIYDLENDPELKFNIDNIVMQGGSSSAVTKASFNVEHVKVVNSDSVDY